jgi:hypothetical protein
MPTAAGSASGFFLFYKKEIPMQDLRNEFARMQNAPSHDPSPFIAIGLLVLLLFAGYACSGETPESREEKYCDSLVHHYTKAEMYIRQHLRDPSSAEFESINSVKSWRSDTCEMTITGHVRAHNGFGGMGREHFTVTTRYDPQRDVWLVGRLKME